MASFEPERLSHPGIVARRFAGKSAVKAGIPGPQAKASARQVLLIIHIETCAGGADKGTAAAGDALFTEGLPDMYGPLDCP